MPAISKIRFTNIVYEDGNKRYNDETFLFDGENSAIVLENGGGKTVFIQTALQAIIPHTNMASRKIRETLTLNEPAHIAIEWIISDRPRRYALTAVSLFRTQDAIDSFRFVTEYAENSKSSIENIPFTKEGPSGIRGAEKSEMIDYYRNEQAKQNGKTFDTIGSFREYIEVNYQIITKEWESIVKINSSEGDIEKFFEKCDSSQQLFEKLLIPTVEDAMYFNKEETFTESFAARREGFKIHRRMTETIREHEAIREQLIDYEKVFSSLHQQTEVFTQVKEKAKTNSIFYKNLLDETTVKNKDNELALEDAGKDLKNLEQRKLAYEVQSLKVKMLDSHEIANNLEQERKIISESFKDLKGQIVSLKVADEKAQIEKEKALITVKEEQLKNLEENIDEEELFNKKDIALRELKGYFLNLEETFKKETDKLEYERTTLENQLLDETEKEKVLTKEHSNLREKIVQTETELSGLKNQAAEIMDKLFTKQINESVGQLKLRLQTETANLEEKIATAKTSFRELEDKLGETEDRRFSLLEEEYEPKTKITLLNKEKLQLDHAHEKMIEDLQEQANRWQLLSNIYLQEETIKESIQNEIERFTLLKNEKLQKERIALRYLDDYEKMDQFYADPFIDQQINKWQNQFTHLEKGTHYIAKLKVDDKLKNDPYWPITLITGTAEVPKLLEKIKEERTNLQYPLRILSLNDANALVNNKTISNEDVITPMHWDFYKETDQFKAWKANLRNHANLVENERIEAEEFLNNWQLTRDKLTNFLRTYPKELEVEIAENIRLETARLEEIRLKIKTCTTSIEQIKKQVSNISKQITDDQDLLGNLNEQLNYTHKYERLDKQADDKRAKLNEHMEEEKLLKRSLSRLSSSIKQTTDELKICNDQLIDIKIAKNSQLENHALYHLSAEINRPLYSDKNFTLLEETYKTIEGQLNKQATERHFIEQELEQHKANIAKARQRLNYHLAETDQIIEITILPSNLDEKIRELSNKQKLEEEALLAKEQQLEAANKQLTKRKTRFEDRLSFYKSNYGDDLISFAGALTTIKTNLSKEQDDLNVRLNRLNTERKGLEKQLSEVTDIINSYKLLDAKFEINHPSLTRQILSEDERLALTYKAKASMKAIEDLLNDAKTSCDNLQAQLEKERARFIRFCDQKIKDSKLKEYTIQGLNVHKSFAETKQFSEHMLQRITNAIKIAERTMREKDKELAQFIHRIYTHLVKVVDELMSIPRKTRVQTADGPREIFKFDIPEWKEHEAKEAIREYVERLGKRLENPNFYDEIGRENSAQIRDEIQNTLNTNQLLNVIVQQKRLKASCRKVTNDLSVSSRYFAWEQSNKWSGGEKWSKNMTLFLGVLIYIAEKNQDLRNSRSKKRHRTVIVDNPFGKASSEHVLQPVFYIAEQLGFQIIALTAHAEGKFLSDYFPVIYSCRLRQAVGSTKQIVEAKKHISMAYFQDRDPETLSRLGEREQLGFDF